MSDVKFPTIPMPTPTLEGLLASVGAIKQGYDILTGQLAGGLGKAVVLQDMQGSINALQGIGGGGGGGTLLDNALKQFKHIFDVEVKDIQNALDAARASAVAELTASLQAEANARALAVTSLNSATDDLQVAIDEYGVSLADVQSQVGANAAAISAEVVARADADSAISGQITTLTATVNSNTAAITAEQVARSDGDSALAGQITTLTATVNSNTAAITAEVIARSDADSALSAQITTLTARVGSTEASIQNSAVAQATSDLALAATVGSLQASISGNTAAITTEQSVRASADDALAGQITTVSAVAGRQRVYVQSTPPAAPTQTPYDAIWVDTAHSNLFKTWNGSAWVASDDTRIASSVSAITSEQVARADADSAFATQMTALTTRVGDAEGLIQETRTSNVTESLALVGSMGLMEARVAGAEASIKDIKVIQVSADLALAATVGTLEASVNSNKASITTETAARADADSALAGQITTAQIQLDNATASGSMRLVAVGNLQTGVGAEFSVDLAASVDWSGSPVFAQSGLRLRAMSDGTSQCLIRANNFIIAAGASIDGQGATYTPFSIVSGALNCLATLDGSLVVTGTITGNKISAGTITGDKIDALTIDTGNLKASAITADKIAASAITADKIAAGAITSESLAVGLVTDNILPNGGFEDGLSRWTAGNAFATIVTGSGAHEGASYVQLDKQAASGGTQTFVTSDKLPIEASGAYEVALWLMGATGTLPTTTGATVRVYWYQQDMVTAASTAYTAVLLNQAYTASWARYAAVATPPADAKYAMVRIYHLATGTARYLYVDAVSVRNVVRGTLIQDGAITTVKIAAGAITAAQIAAGAITADMITTGALNADLITVGTLNAARITVGTITADHIQINSLGVKGFNSALDVDLSGDGVFNLVSITLNLTRAGWATVRGLTGTFGWGTSNATGQLLITSNGTLRASGQVIVQPQNLVLEAGFSAPAGSTTFILQVYDPISLNICHFASMSVDVDYTVG